MIPLIPEQTQVLSIKTVVCDEADEQSAYHVSALARKAAAEQMVSRICERYCTATKDIHNRTTEYRMQVAVMSLSELEEAIRQAYVCGAYDARKVR